MVDLIFRPMSFTKARNSRGPSTLPCGTPDVTLTSSDNYIKGLLKSVFVFLVLRALFIVYLILQSPFPKLKSTRGPLRHLAVRPRFRIVEKSNVLKRNNEICCNLVKKVI